MEKRFTVETEIEILKHEVSVLKALCVDLRKTMQAQDDMKEQERAKKNELARKTKTVDSQATEVCDERTKLEGYGLAANHSWVEKSKTTQRALVCWKECGFCGEEKLKSRVSLS